MRVKVSISNGSPESLIGQPAVAAAEQLQNTLNLTRYGPATNILRQIHSEHLYSSPVSDGRKDTREKQRSTEDVYSDEDSDYDDDDLLSLNIPVSFASHDNGNDRQCSQSDMFNINADSIQRHFQSMIDMTLLAPLPDTETPRRRSPRINKVNFVENLPGTPETQKDDVSKIVSEKVKKDKIKLDLNESINTKSNTNPNSPSNDNKDPKRKQKRKAKQRAKTSIDGKEVSKNDLIQVNAKEWKALNKAMDLERELTVYLKRAEELMVKKWAEYLTMTSEQLQRFEVKNAKEKGMVKEVIDMLEDDDRYVWQLIDELVLF